MLDYHEHSPIQWNGHSTQPCSEHGANQSSVDFVNGQKQRDNLPPGLAIYAMYVYQRKSAEQRDVSATEQGMQMMCGGRRAEKDEGSSEERCCGERGQEEG
jgi:hypothetical protein